MKVVSDLPRRPPAAAGAASPVSGSPPRPGRSRPKDRHDRGGAPWSNGGREPSAGGSAPAKPVNRGSKRLLVYILDVSATLAQNQVVIDLSRRQRRPTGEWGPLKAWWHGAGTPQAKYDPEDRDLLALLDEAQAAALAAAAGLGNGVVPGAPIEQMGTRRYVLRHDPAALFSGWRGPAGSGSGGPRGRTTRPRCGGMTAPPGGSRSTSAPSWAASAGPGAARSAAASRGWTWPSRWCSSPAW